MKTFAFLFLQQTYLQKLVLSINIKESLVMKKVNLFFKLSTNMTRIPLKTIRIQMKLKKISYYTIYDTFFPMNKTKIQPKVLESPWITKGMKKSSKKNQLLFSKLKKKK